MKNLKKLRAKISNQKHENYDCTVVVLAYNAELYIADCLASIESQSTSYKIKILVHDDCSTDETVSIIDKFARSSKFDFEVVRETRNQFQINRFDFFYKLLERCESKYIALLDADDIWTAPDKLETQIGMMEENPEIAITSHPFSTFSDASSAESITWPNPEFRKTRSTYVDLARENFIGTLTVVFRRSCLPVGLIGFNTLGTGDYPLWGLISSRGTIGFIDRVMAKYRVHDSQYYNSKSISEKQYLVLEAKIFVASNTEGEIRRSWINAIQDDVAQSFLNQKVAEDNQLPIDFEETHSNIDSSKLCQLQEQISNLTRIIHVKEMQLDDFRASWSWRITKPLRRVIDISQVLLSRFQSKT